MTIAIEKREIFDQGRKESVVFDEDRKEFLIFDQGRQEAIGVFLNIHTLLKIFELTSDVWLFLLAISVLAINVLVTTVGVASCFRYLCSIR